MDYADTPSRPVPGVAVRRSQRLGRGPQAIFRSPEGSLAEGVGAGSLGGELDHLLVAGGVEVTALAVLSAPGSGFCPQYRQVPEGALLSSLDSLAIQRRQTHYFPFFGLKLVAKWLVMSSSACFVGNFQSHHSHPVDIPNCLIDVRRCFRRRRCSG